MIYLSDSIEPTPKGHKRIRLFSDILSVYTIGDNVTVSNQHSELGPLIDSVKPADVDPSHIYEILLKPVVVVR